MQLTNKQFRAILNAAIPAGSPDCGKGQYGRFKPSKRAYGDYLWFQDRDMFNVEKADYEAGKHGLCNRAALTDEAK